MFLTMLDSALYFLEHDFLSEGVRRAFNQHKALCNAFWSELLCLHHNSDSNTSGQVFNSEYCKRIQSSGYLLKTEFRPCTVLAEITEVCYPWDSIENLREFSLKSTPNKARKKFLDMLNDMTNHHLIKEHSGNMEVILNIVLQKVLNCQGYRELSYLFRPGNFILSELPELPIPPSRLRTFRRNKSFEVEPKAFKVPRLKLWKRSNKNFETKAEKNFKGKKEYYPPSFYSVLQNDKVQIETDEVNLSTVNEMERTFSTEKMFASYSISDLLHMNEASGLLLTEFDLNHDFIHNSEKDTKEMNWNIDVEEIDKMDLSLLNTPSCMFSDLLESIESRVSSPNSTVAVPSPISQDSPKSIYSDQDDNTKIDISTNFMAKMWSPCDNYSMFVNFIPVETIFSSSDANDYDNFNSNPQFIQSGNI
jgi:hypothetical protein